MHLWLPSHDWFYIFWHLIHLPFILLIMVTIARLAGVLKNQQLWAICLLLCFAAFALLAGIWLLGATVPFWTMRGSIGGN